MAGELQAAYERLSNQARFVGMIVDKQLVVSNRKKAEIVVDLKRHNFKPIPKAKAKAAGETEELVEDEEEDEEAAGNNSDFDYLLSMAISSLTREKVSFWHHACQRICSYAVLSDRETPPTRSGEGGRTFGTARVETGGNVEDRSRQVRRRMGGKCCRITAPRSNAFSSAV